MSGELLQVALIARGLLLISWNFCREDETNTFCGTPHYMAPEVVAGRGYGAAADWWSFGVLLYEMISGYTPFGAEDDAAVFREILGAEIR